MFRAIIRLFSYALIALFCVSTHVSYAKSDKVLLSINDVEYTDEDFKHWWIHWNDNDKSKKPSSLDEFVNFQLMAQQGKEMGYDTQEEYLHKLSVFLQVRALMALKYDEVDSKAVVSEDDILKYFNEYYSTKWTLQILSFDSEAKALRVFEIMKPFKSNPAGQLVFADLYGGSAEDKAETYDEVKVTAFDFHTNNKDKWLLYFKDLGAGEVSVPFLNESDNRYILVRVIDKQNSSIDSLAEKRKNIVEVLSKEKRDALTLKLLEALRAKYNVKVDSALLASIRLDGDYAKEFLDQKIATGDGFSSSVRDIVFNSLREKSYRKSVPDDEVKSLALNSLISQALVNKESLARGYEKKPPLLWTFNYYKENRLRQEVEEGLAKSITPTDQEIQNYYDQNSYSYSIPDKFVYLLVNGEEGVLRNVWIGTLQGGDFNDLSEKYSIDVLKQNFDTTHIPVEILSELKKLNNGGVSAPFLCNKSYSLLKLLDRVPGQVVPLPQVKDKIVGQLKKEQFNAVKAEYINKLKSKSKIDIHERVWNSLLSELGNAQIK